MVKILRSPFDPVVVWIAAIIVCLTGVFLIATSRDGRERTLRLLFLYLTYGVLEIVVKRGAHYVWYIYLIKYALFGVVIISWWQWRHSQHALASRKPPLKEVLGLYLALAVLQVFNPSQANVLVGVLGWLSDYVFAALYFVAFDVFDDVRPVRRWLWLTAALGVLSALACFAEQWIGPGELMKTYPSYVRFLYYGPNGIEYRPVSLSSFNEILGIAALLALLSSQRRSLLSLLLMGAAITACVVANALHAVRIAWITGIFFIAFFGMLAQRRRAVSVLLLVGSIALAINISLTLTDGLIASSFTSLTEPVRTFQGSRLRGVKAIGKIVSEYPFGAGVGESSAGLRLIDASGVTTFGTHNYIAELTAQMSLVGPLLLLAFSAGVLWKGFKSAWPVKHDEWRTYVCLGIALFGAVTATFFGGGGLGSYPLNDYFWLTAGVVMSLRHARAVKVAAPARPQSRLDPSRRGPAVVHPIRPGGPRPVILR